VPDAPTGGLGKIALALSGGGFRAAAFHLGTMKALRDVKLIDDVRLLSTASGGSILGGLWVTSIAAGQGFGVFEAKATELLERNIVKEALNRLHDGERRPSLIQRAAEVYDGIYGGQRLGQLAANPNVARQLQHVVVNATHFSLGYGFRFTFPPRPRSYFGNKVVRLGARQNDAWADVRLADAVAASSCFPAGFEPLHFPGDFAWSGPAPSVTAQGIGSRTTEDSVPLMDGGIYDN
jgi:predicted acylesterase/phospholipase RssA